MTTKLDKPLKRQLDVDGEPYTLTISPQGLHLVPKGRRKGYELTWNDMVSGDAALATALNASLRLGPKPQINNAAEEQRQAAPKRSRKTRRR